MLKFLLSFVLLATLHFGFNCGPAKGQESDYLETLEEAHLNLEAGEYNLSLKFWIDPSATLSGCYTYIEDQWRAFKWDFGSVVKGEWVELSQRLILDAPVSGSRFIIHVPASLGNGDLYIDDIAIREVEEEIPTSVDYGGEQFAIYPNPASGALNVKTTVKVQISVYTTSGVLVHQGAVDAGNSVVMLGHVPAGMYVLKMADGKSVFSKKVRIN